MVYEGLFLGSMLLVLFTHYHAKFGGPGEGKDTEADVGQIFVDQVEENGTQSPQKLHLSNGIKKD